MMTINWSNVIFCPGVIDLMNDLQDLLVGDEKKLEQLSKPLKVTVLLVSNSLIKFKIIFIRLASV